MLNINLKDKTGTVGKERKRLDIPDGYARHILPWLTLQLDGSQATITVISHFFDLLADILIKATCLKLTAVVGTCSRNIVFNPFGFPPPHLFDTLGRAWCRARWCHEV